MIKGLSYVGRVNAKNKAQKIDPDHRLELVDVSVNLDRIGFTELMNVASGALYPDLLTDALETQTFMTENERNHSKAEEKVVHRGEVGHIKQAYHEEDYERTENNDFGAYQYDKTELRHIKKSDLYLSRLRELVGLQELLVKKNIRDR